MKRLPFAITSTIAALWIVAIATIAVQNATPVSLRFLSWTSIEIPFGIVLAFAAAVGLVSGSISIFTTSK
ncbi:MAG: DUF1049 domain-containing protein [Cyanobacteria bacterium SID2]|nr:DUF1049 domain-containing protein [Cyanobacteria bacterium SID2]MBP0002942.1 DUF1049 domain-containing protein [Cyanobacteria bacterium SBC]